MRPVIVPRDQLRHYPQKDLGNLARQIRQTQKSEMKKLLRELDLKLA
jgi:hypothetical protein